MAEKHLRKCSIFLPIREIQIKTTLRFHLTLARMAKINKTNGSSCCGGCGVRDHSSFAGGSANLYSHCGNQCGSSIGRWELILPQDPAISLLGTHPKDASSQHSIVHCCSIHNSQKLETT